MRIVQDSSGRKKYNNGRRHLPVVKQEARRLRRQEGLTHREIVERLGISLGSAYLWTKNIKPINKQKQAIEERRVKGGPVWTKAERIKTGKRLRSYQFKKQHTRQSLIKEILNFYKQNGRIPLKKEFNSRRSFRTYFGSWNNAIRAAGFEPNPEFFAKRVKAQDGHMCDSFTESIIDNWLFNNHIPHERSKRYPNSRMTTDFYIPSCNLFIEYFGLKGASRIYDRSFLRKMDLVKKLDLNFLALFANDIENLDDKFSSIFSLTNTNSSHLDL